MTKRKAFNTCIILALIIVCGLYFYPKPLSSIFSKGERISIEYSHYSSENGKPIVDSTVYQFDSNADGYFDIVKLFEQYNYHSNVISLFKSTSIDYTSSDVDYSFNIYNEYHDISTFIAMGGTGKILVNGHLYSMGFCGNKYQIEFMEQLKGILEDNQQAN